MRSASFVVEAGSPLTTTGIASCIRWMRCSMAEVWAASVPRMMVQNIATGRRRNKNEVDMLNPS